MIRFIRYSLPILLLCCGSATAEQPMITRWKLETTLLRASPQAPPVRRRSAELPVPAPITEHERDFLRFTDSGGDSWLVSKFDVTTNQPAPTPSAPELRAPCIQLGSMGIRSGCQR